MKIKPITITIGQRTVELEESEELRKNPYYIFSQLIHQNQISTLKRQLALLNAPLKLPEYLEDFASLFCKKYNVNIWDFYHQCFNLCRKYPERQRTILSQFFHLLIDNNWLDTDKCADYTKVARIFYTMFDVKFRPNNIGDFQHFKKPKYRYHFSYYFNIPICTADCK